MSDVLSCHAKEELTVEMDCEVLVIGAGPSGTVAASKLKKEGVDVRVVEKGRFPRFVIGESLIPRCMDHFEEAGLLNRLKSEGFESKLGARFIRDGQTCQFNFSEQYTTGWTWTWQVPRARFDQVLAEETMRKGVPIAFGTGVSSIEFGDESQVVRMDNGEHIRCKFIIDSSGYGRVIPRMLDLDEPSSMPPRSAFFAHVDDPRRPEGEEGTQITFVVLSQEVWYWIIPFSDGITSLGFVGPPEYFEELGTDLEMEFRKHVGAEPMFSERFSNVSFRVGPTLVRAYSIGVKQLFGRGYALTGNATEFLDPVFSSGVSFATESGLLAAKLAARQVKGGEVDWQAEYADYINQGVDTFRSYVKAWYNGDLQEIFFHSNHNAKIKRQICSVLAGYVWDTTNPFVSSHKTVLGNLRRIIS